MRYLITLSFLILFPSFASALSCGTAGQKYVSNGQTYQLTVKVSGPTWLSNCSTGGDSWLISVINGYDRYTVKYATAQGSCASGMTQGYQCVWALAQVAATCTDGLLNGAETDTDCGGSCAPCGPDLCLNNVNDPGEIGVDCGGTCSAVCEKQCPAGYEPASNYENLQHVILFGFIFGGDYSNDPDACVQITSTDNDLGCSNTWLAYGPKGNKTVVCGNLHSKYNGPTGSPPPPIVVDITFPNGGGPPPITPPPAETPPAPPDAPPDGIGEKCVEKTMSDGSQCTICTSSTGSGSVTCTGTDGTLALTKPTVQTPIVDGCNKITYGNGTTCDVCRDPETGVQTVNCKDSSQNPVDPGVKLPLLGPSINRVFRRLHCS